jgi:hypothetical protein
MTAVSTLKTFQKSYKKLAQEKNNRIFLLRCRTEDISPSHINNYFQKLHRTCNIHHKYQKEFDNIVNRFKKSLLNLEIKSSICNITKTERIITECIEQCKSILPSAITDEFQNKLKEQYENKYKLIKNRQVNKFNKLHKQTCNNIGNEKWFVNLTKKDIPADVKQFLSLGPKYSIPFNNNRLPIEKLISDVEYYIQYSVKEEDKETVRGQCVNVITNFKNQIKNKSGRNLTDKLANKTKQFLRCNPDIYITKTDKTNQTVAINKDEYITKTIQLLNDKDTYKKVPRNPTHSLMNDTNKHIRLLFKDKYIDEVTFKKLINNAPTSPKLYSLVKNHKDGNPVRPIVSFVNSPTYELARYLASILSHLSTNKYNVKDSFEFHRKISNVHIPPNYHLTSLDASSLFTNISIPVVTKIIADRFEELKPYTKIPKKQFLELLKLCLERGYFQFNNEFYLQLFGCPMGSPIAPILADIYLEYILDKKLPTLTFSVPFLYKFVDDIITAIPINKQDIMIETFNDFHSRLIFTTEHEKPDGSIPFLDVLLIHQPNGKINTKWWQKPQNSGRYIHYTSHCPHHYKINVAKNLINRAHRLTSAIYKKEVDNRLVDLLLINGYPHKLICTLMRESNKTRNIQKIYDNNSDLITSEPTPRKLTDQGTISNTQKAVNTPTKYFSLPYIKSLSEKLSKILTDNNQNTKITYRNVNTLNKFFTCTKDSDEIELKSNVIYEIPCQENCGKKYYGCSEQYVKRRIYQHKYSCDKIKTNKHDPTALTQHARLHNHTFQFHKTKIVHTENNHFKRQFLEMITIEKNKNISVNKKADVQNLSKCYSNLIHSQVKPVRHNNRQ